MGRTITIHDQAVVKLILVPGVLLGVTAHLKEMHHFDKMHKNVHLSALGTFKTEFRENNVYFSGVDLNMGEGGGVLKIVI